MGKLPRGVSGKDAVRVFEKVGFTFRNQTGSHVSLSRGTDRISVPMHSSLATGTLHSLIKQANLTIDEFNDLLK